MPNDCPPCPKCHAAKTVRLAFVGQAEEYCLCETCGHTWLASVKVQALDKTDRRQAVRRRRKRRFDD